MSNDMVAVAAAAMGALAVSGLAYAFLAPYFSTDREKETRVKGIISPKRDAASVLEQVASRRRSVADTLKDIENRQKAEEKASLRLRLERAGLDITPRTYWLASLLSGVVFACRTGESASIR